MRRRVRHVVTENGRVLEAADLLRAGRVAELGPLLDASHASMRDDFEITVPTVDLAVETARAAGALGARMTGGGFGGCIIALVPAGLRPGRAEQIARRFADGRVRPAGPLRRRAVSRGGPGPLTARSRDDQVPNRLEVVVHVGLRAKLCKVVRTRTRRGVNDPRGARHGLWRRICEHTEEVGPGRGAVAALD